MDLFIRWLNFTRWWLTYSPACSQFRCLKFPKFFLLDFNSFLFCYFYWCCLSCLNMNFKNFSFIRITLNKNKIQKKKKCLPRHCLLYGLYYFIISAREIKAFLFTNLLCHTFKHKFKKNEKKQTCVWFRKSAVHV